VTDGVARVTFPDLRVTAVVRLAPAGCTEAEIAIITGHSLRSANAVLGTLPESRSGARGKRDQKARKGNGSAQMPMPACINRRSLRALPIAGRWKDQNKHSGSDGGVTAVAPRS
jgi:hypothetical protein